MHYVRNAQRLLLLRVKIQKILGGHTMTKLLVKHTTVSGHTHDCEVTGEGWEGEWKIYDLACGRWAYFSQVQFLEI
tara:strand:- start:19 stop:246 length:228 start_codon:yes stop_codon:yes gene_type:complete